MCVHVLVQDMPPSGKGNAYTTLRDSHFLVPSLLTFVGFTWVRVLWGPEFT